MFYGPITVFEVYRVVGSQENMRTTEDESVCVILNAVVKQYDFFLISVRF